MLDFKSFILKATLNMQEAIVTYFSQKRDFGRMFDEQYFDSECCILKNSNKVTQIIRRIYVTIQIRLYVTKIPIRQKGLMTLPKYSFL